jgi:hypothetical protein
MPVLKLSLQTSLTIELQQKALDSLYADYDVLVTGKARKLNPKVTQLGIKRTESERLADTLYRRNFNLKYRTQFTKVDVTLTPKGLQEREGNLVLRAEENVAMHFMDSGRKSDLRGNVTRMQTYHNFVFEKVDNQ